MTDYYAILGVSRNANPNEIREAYLKLARDTHPDKVKDPAARKEAENRFKFVTAAYDTLSRDRSRREYTAKLAPETTATASTPRQTPPVVQGPPLGPKPASAPQAPAAAQAAAIPSTPRATFDALGQGIEAFNKQDYHTAVQLLNVAVSQNENSPRAHAALSRALAKNPNWIREAMNHMETASKLDPKNVAYLVELALFLQSQGLKLRAKRTLENAVALNPEHPEIQRALKEIPLAPPEGDSLARTTAETARGLFDRLRKR
jgi:curved DNA-binding protein CbpA